MAAINVTVNNFEEEVMKSKETVLVDFWASWCGPCRALMPIVEQIAEERNDIKVVKINIDEQPQLAARFNIMSVPTLLVIKDGEIINQSIGAKPKQQILEML